MSAAARIIPAGAAVYTADGAPVGRARERRAGYLHVQRDRPVGRDDYYFPVHTVARVDEAAMRVELALTTDQVEAGDWATPPAPAAG